jgi:hypothetical protein
VEEFAMRVIVTGALALLLSLGSSRAQADPFLLARVQMSLTQVLGCESDCMGNGLNGSGLLEMVIDPVTHQIVAASPMFSVLEPFHEQPRLVRFGGGVPLPGADCDDGNGGFVPCFQRNVLTLSQLEGTSAGAWRDFLIEPPGWRSPDPFYGILPTDFDIQEEGFIDGRHVWFWGNGTVESVTAVNSSLLPVPEPASLVLLGVGLVAVTAKRWKNVQKRV